MYKPHTLVSWQWLQEQKLHKKESRMERTQGLQSHTDLASDPVSDSFQSWHLVLSFLVWKMGMRKPFIIFPIVCWSAWFLSLLSPVNSICIMCPESFCSLVPFWSKPSSSLCWGFAIASYQVSLIFVPFTFYSPHSIQDGPLHNQIIIKSSTYKLLTVHCKVGLIWFLVSVSLSCSCTSSYAFITQFQSHWPPFYFSNTWHLSPPPPTSLCTSCYYCLVCLLLSLVFAQPSSCHSDFSSNATSTNGLLF